MAIRDNLLRIGEIDYTNVWPIFYYFPIEHLEGSVELVRQVPTELNRAIASGEVDMGPISSFAYGENFADYMLFPDLSVSSFGKVNSILLFYQKPFERLLQGRIALPTTSATSVNLLKIILNKFYQGAPAYFYAKPSLQTMLADADGALLIGDDAIRANWANKDYDVLDLGEMWNRLTGHWMSFAVWAIRKDTVERHPGMVGRVFDAFLESKQKGLKHPKDMILAAQKNIGGTYSYWEHYFANLCYDFGTDQWQGLSLYYQYACELGLLRQEVPIRIWNHKKCV
ncbi:menaquinone biosynthesis protein [Ferviditalea candida]|uniref:Chorismate dehydratase n=1 Tax=Ferviditalea candida TaxID=3108399 RepID=A0ABU5ZMU8_9BACL|nr:menaquinone biosynthesis protein [Paenibacillaceae bacterium T2]